MTNTTVTSHLSENGILSVEINRPEKRNAFNRDVVHGLNEAFLAAESNPHVKLVLLSGNGGYFSAGADLNAMQAMVHASYDENVEDAINLAHMLKNLATLSKPVVAKVSKLAFGGAIGLIACADIAIADDQCRFALSEVKLGLAPATISPYVIRAIGRRACQRLFITGEIFSAQTAKEYNLLHEVVAEQALDDKVAEICNAICRNGPAAISACKRLIDNIDQREIDEALISDTAHLLATLRISDEGQEGLQAFLQKRQPAWITQKPGEDA